MGEASHRRTIKRPGYENAFIAITGPPLYRGYERAEAAASISYAAMRIFTPMARSRS